jgi:plastocyanin
VVGVLLYTAAVPSSAEAQSRSQESRESRIEIVIEDRAFFLARGGLFQIGTLIEIVVENRDKVRHGFTSPMLSGLLVFGEDDQIATYGRGVEGFYVNPGKTLVSRFKTERPGNFPFYCDLHERMKGEVYVLEVPAV